MGGISFSSVAGHSTVLPPFTEWKEEKEIHAKKRGRARKKEKQIEKKEKKNRVREIEKILLEESRRLNIHE